MKTDLEEFEMPTPCQSCGEIFDLHDGVASQKWFKNTMICEECGDVESSEIERDEEIEELKELIDEAIFTIKDAKQRLSELGVNCEIDVNVYTTNYK